MEKGGRVSLQTAGSALAPESLPLSLPLSFIGLAAITDDQVVNKLQAVHFSEGRKHTHTQIYTIILANTSKTTLAGYHWPRQTDRQTGTVIGWLYAALILREVAGPVIWCAHQNVSQTAAWWKWGGTSVNLAAWRRRCRMILPISWTALPD